LSHIPGLKVVAPATPADAKGLLKSAIRDNNPVIVLEGEMLYNTKGEVPEGEHVVPIGRAEVKRAGSDVTLICHSKTVTVALKAAEQLQEQNVSAEVLDLRSLRPMDEPAILASIAKTNRAVVVEEGWPHCGVGAQVVDIIQRDAFDQLDAPVQRVTQADVPMPYNKHLERAAKASPEKVVAAARRGPGKGGWGKGEGPSPLPRRLRHLPLRRPSPMSALRRRHWPSASRGRRAST